MSKAKNKNATYWGERFEYLESLTNLRAKKTLLNLDKSFFMAQREIEKNIDSWYQRLADNNELSFAEAKKLLNKQELKEFKWNVEEYIEYAKKNALGEDFKKELENASAKFHIERLEALRLDNKFVMEKLKKNLNDSLTSAARETIEENYYHSVFEVQRGLNSGFYVAKVNDRLVDKLINKPWTKDGKTFSNRIWVQKEKMIDELHKGLMTDVLLGKPADKAIKDIMPFVDTKFKNAKTWASALVNTELASFHSLSQKEAFNDLEVEEFEIVAVLDSKTSKICQGMDGKHFKMSDYEIGLTAPPFHVRCRSVTCPYFDDDFVNGKRAARGEDGKTYYVPGDITYKEWRKEFVNLEKELSHKGINRKTQINKKEIYSNAYDRKISSLGENKKLTRVIKNECINILEHRNGTTYEDLVFIHADTGNILKQSNYNKKSTVKPSKAMFKMLQDNENNRIIAIHNHPESTLPSADDLLAAFKRGYKYGLIACHNGDIYKYEVKEEMDRHKLTEYGFRCGRFYSGLYKNEKDFFGEIEEYLGVIIRRL